MLGQMLAFTIATYNIHKCRGLDRRVRPNRIVDVLKETGADVIALQEVVGMDHADRHNHDVTWRESEPRGCLEVLLELGGQEAIHRLRIFNVHLGTGYFERRYQSKKLLDIMNHDSRDTAPRLVLGDFNEWPRGLTSHLLETHFNIAEPPRRLGRARSYPGILPLAHVDHIYYDSPLEATKVSIHRT